MALIKYKVLQSGIENAISNVPEKAIPLGVLPDANTGKIVVAFMMKYSDWAEEFPGEAQAEALIHNAETIKDDKEKGVPDGQ